MVMCDQQVAQLEAAVAVTNVRAECHATVGLAASTATGGFAARDLDRFITRRATLRPEAWDWLG